MRLQPAAVCLASTRVAQVPPSSRRLAAAPLGIAEARLEREQARVPRSQRLQSVRSFELRLLVEHSPLCVFFGRERWPGGRRRGRPLPSRLRVRDRVWRLGSLCSPCPLGACSWPLAARQARRGRRDCMAGNMPTRGQRQVKGGRTGTSCGRIVRSRRSDNYVHQVLQLHGCRLQPVVRLVAQHGDSQHRATVAHEAGSAVENRADSCRVGTRHVLAVDRQQDIAIRQSGEAAGGARATVSGSATSNAYPGS